MTVMMYSHVCVYFVRTVCRKLTSVQLLSRCRADGSLFIWTPPEVLRERQQRQQEAEEAELEEPEESQLQNRDAAAEQTAG